MVTFVATVDVIVPYLNLFGNYYPYIIRNDASTSTKSSANTVAAVFKSRAADTVATEEISIVDAVISVA